MVRTGKEEHRLQMEKKIDAILKNAPAEVEDFYNHIYSSKSYNTHYRYINIIIGFLEYIKKKPEDVTMADVERYLRRKSGRGEERKSGSYLVQVYSALKAFFEYMVDCGRIDRSPMERVKRPKPKPADQVERTFLTPDEVNRCFDVVRKSNDKFAKRNLAMLVVYFATGIRNSALTEINVDNIDLKNNVIYVVDKGNKARECSVSPEAMAIIKDWIDERATYNLDTKALFISSWNRRITTQGASNVIHYVSDQIGHKISPHGARRSFCSNAKASGIPLEVVSKMMNHSSTKVTSDCYVLGQDEVIKSATIKGTSYINF